MRINHPVSGIEVPLRDDTMIVSRTNLTGLIEYVNREFVEISGFTEAELIGAPHNIVRHPDMPTEAFADFWKTLKSGKPWTGMVKNRCKNGDHYWVEANATPLYENGKVVGFMSVRLKPSAQQVADAESAYRAFREGKAKGRRILRGRVVSDSLAKRVLRRATGSSMKTRGLVYAGCGAALIGALQAGLLHFQSTGAISSGTALVATGGAALAGFALWTLFVLAALRPLQQLQATLRMISEGRLDGRIELKRDDEFGRLLDCAQTIKIKLGFDLAEGRRRSEEMTRIKIGLDHVATNVMIADRDLNIIYLNQAIGQMFDVAESDIRKDLPNFDAKHLLGTNIDVFHKHPEHQRAMLQKLTGIYRAQILIGGRSFKLNVAPVMDERGARLGTVVEWVDRTAEVSVEAEINGIVAAATAGDLNQRLSLDDKAGFFRVLAEGINQLLHTCASGIDEVGRVLSSVAAGDLTQSVETEFGGAFGRLSDSTNATASSLRELVTRIRTSSESVHVAAREIAAGNGDLSARTEQQASSLQETASSMEVLTEAVRNNADHAQKANQLSINARQTALQGGEAVGKVVDTMSAIHDSSTRIADIISVIDSIAFQTNILALNAAVEAARAGEQGKGFAVVAAEVRSLAQKAAGAAKEIKQLIGASVEKVGEGRSLVDEAGKTMEAIIGSISQVTALMSEITAASQEQRSGIEQVNNTVAHMDQATQQNAAMVEEISSAAHSLEAQANGLVDTVRQFVVSRDADPTGENSGAAPASRTAAQRRAVVTSLRRR